MRSLSLKIACFVARVVIGLSCLFVAGICKMLGCPTCYPIAWLAHYLIGNGSDLYVDEGLFLKLVQLTFVGDVLDEISMGITEAGAWHAGHALHSMIGGFTWRVAGDVFSVVDRYDWHVSDDMQGNSYWATICVDMPALLVLALRQVLSIVLYHVIDDGMRTYSLLGDLITIDGDQLRVSDRLWPTLGGHEFNTHITVRVSEMRKHVVGA